MTASSQYDTAVKLVRERRKASVSFLQREMGLDYYVAMDFIKQMERDKIISDITAQGKRKVLNPIKKPKQKYSPEDYLRSG